MSHRHLSINEVRELLESLRSTLQEFAAAEEKLNRDFRTRTEAAQRRFDEEIAAHDTRLNDELRAAGAEFESARASQCSKFEQRKARLAKAHKSAMKQRLQRVDDEEGRGKYQSQKGLLDTKRWRADSLAQNDATLAEFNQRLGESQNEFASLEADAARAFRDYGTFRKWLSHSKPPANIDLSPDEYQLLEQFQQVRVRASEDLARFRKVFLPKLFSIFPLWLWIGVALICFAVLFVRKFVPLPISDVQAIAAGAAVLALSLMGYVIGRKQAARRAKPLADYFATARRLHQACAEKAQARHAAEIERIETEAKNRTDEFQSRWETAIHEATHARDVWPGHVDQKAERALGTNERQHNAKLAALERKHAERIGRLQSEADARKRHLTEEYEARSKKFRADFDAHWQKLEADWSSRIGPIHETIQRANVLAEQDFPRWDRSMWANWTPPDAFKNAAKFARIEADLKRFADAAPQDSRLGFRGLSTVSLPLVLTYPQQGSVLFETTKSGNEPVFASLNEIIFRLLATTPAGKLSFTIIDPVKLGQNFATVMHLADYEDNVINGRIWTQPNQIDERLGELNEHMEKVIQMYLRNEYETIADYNREAGNIAEKYHFVVVADFPANFTETGIKRLLRIAASGARCGVYTLIHWDHRHTAPPDFFPEELRKASVCINVSGEQFVLAHPLVARAKVLLDAPPDPEFATEFLHKVGEKGRGSNRVEVPFTQVAPQPEQVWTLETTEELRVPIGRSGATKLQYLAIGKGTRQHALVAGKTGSGKSTLFHVIITNLAMWASPEQVEFYLVDFKKGVEFKSYAAHRLPHARVVAIESDREFGLSVLQKLDDELRRRGDLFRKLGVQDVAGYKRAGGTEPMPRCLLIIDEFQEFFVEDDRISQAANLLLDRIVRQGRAFGIHVILGSQTLGGAYTLARTTIGQMVIRIALQCNEADAYLIMDENNAAPRLLSRPGEGIYNDSAGAIEANSPFQTVWLDDDERDRWLEQVRRVANRNDSKYAGPIVFEGNAPADVRENATLRQLLEVPGTPSTGSARIWLGAPNSIKGPTEAVFQRRSGNNLLIVGQREEAVLAMLSIGLISLAAQFPRGAARFIVFESTPPGSAERAYLEEVVRAIPHEVVLGKPGDLGEIINGLAADLQKRGEDDSTASPVTFLFLHGMQNFKKLRQDDDLSFSLDDSGGTNPAQQLLKIISEGPAHDIHVIATLDTYNNVNRFLGRKMLSEFEMRVLFQMSANDSASLCDDPKASTLGLHRALLYNEQEGYLETFRPYALPPREWIEGVAKRCGTSLH